MTRSMIAVLLFLSMTPSTAFTSVSRSSLLVKEQLQVRNEDLFQLAATIEPPEKTYGETSRKFRRSFFSHKDWLKHRSEDRFLKIVLSTVNSGVVRQLAKEVGFVVATATFVVFWNSLLGEGYSDFSGVHHDPLVQGLPLMELPITPFTLSSPALGLLLGE